jgi:hypothetical protein
VGFRCGNKIHEQSHPEGRQREEIPYVSVALVALVCSAVGLHAAEGGTLSRTAAATGTYKRPLFIVDGVGEKFLLARRLVEAGVSDSDETHPFPRDQRRAVVPARNPPRRH